MPRLLKHLPAGHPTWTGEAPIPGVGSDVPIAHSNWGTVKVKGYTVEDGFLGVVAEPLNPPQWWLDQKKKHGQRHRNVVFFGVDVALQGLEG